MSLPTVFIGSEFVAKCVRGGGNFWVPLQYLRGLRELGYDAWWLELLGGSGDPALDRERLAWFHTAVAESHAGEHVALAYFPGRVAGDLGADVVWHTLDEAGFRERARHALLLNLANSVPVPIRESFARTALLDIDPGPFQLWAREWDMGVGGHDVHVTIGMNLGAEDSPIPMGDVEWKRVWPCVHLSSWPCQPPPAPDSRYTTITQWWTNHYATLDGEIFDCNKRQGFARHIDLPRVVGFDLELAANVHPEEAEERALLARHGWQLVDPLGCAGLPSEYQHYVQRARGELSAAKPAYVKARSGWVSDRTICFLASGRPAIVEDVGAARHLPVSLGLGFFRDVNEAAARLRAVEAQYARACSEARALAAEVFDSRVVLPTLLADCGL